MHLDEPARKLLALIKPVPGCMMVTFNGNGGQPRTRPMFTLGADPDTYDGHLWFFTSLDSAKVAELNADDRVLLVYADSGANNYISITGDATVVRDRDKVRQLWNIHAKAWFPLGADDPSLALIRVTPQRAEYWEGPSTVSYVISLAKAIITKDRVDPTGKHGVVSMNS